MCNSGHVYLHRRNCPYCWTPPPSFTSMRWTLEILFPRPGPFVFHAHWWCRCLLHFPRIKQYVYFSPSPFPYDDKMGGNVGLDPPWVQSHKSPWCLGFFVWAKADPGFIAPDHWAWHELYRILHGKCTNECSSFCFLDHEICLVQYNKSSKKLPIGTDAIGQNGM